MHLFSSEFQIVLDSSRSGSPRSPSPYSFDISELLSEIKSLRVQLERSIEANIALRRQLEEQLNHPKSNASTPRKLTTINIHHLAPSSTSTSPHQTQFMESSPRFSHGKEDSPNSLRGSARRKLKLNQGRMKRISFIYYSLLRLCRN